MPSNSARAEASAEARKSLANELANASAPVPCPQCGEYQPGMKIHPTARVFLFRRIAAVAIVLAAIAAFLGYARGELFSPVLTTVLLGMFGALAIVIVLMSRRLGPATAEERKALGRRYALYGGQVWQLEQTLAPAKTDFFVDRQGRTHSELR